MDVRTSDGDARNAETVRADGPAKNDAGGETEELRPLVQPSRPRFFSVSKDKPVVRIPGKIKTKNLTPKAKRPSVDIEFHELTYAVNTTAGTYAAPVLYFLEARLFRVQ